MAKTNRATRKELEGIVQEIIKELSFLKQGIAAIDSYLGIYIEFKGDRIGFDEYLRNKVEEMKRQEASKTEQPHIKDSDNAKKSRYNKIKTPL